MHATMALVRCIRKYSATNLAYVAWVAFDKLGGYSSAIGAIHGQAWNIERRPSLKFNHTNPLELEIARRFLFMRVVSDAALTGKSYTSLHRQKNRGKKALHRCKA